jgi:hypothetical protein
MLIRLGIMGIEAMPMELAIPELMLGIWLPWPPPAWLPGVGYGNIFSLSLAREVPLPESKQQAFPRSPRNNEQWTQK